MPEKGVNNVGAWEVELTVGRVERLSVSAGIASQLLSGLFELNLMPGELTELVGTDPAMSALVFSLAHQKDISFPDEKPSIASAIGKVELRELRDEFLSSTIYSIGKLWPKPYLMHSWANPVFAAMSPRKQKTLFLDCTYCSSIYKYYKSTPRLSCSTTFNNIIADYN